MSAITPASSTKSPSQAGFERQEWPEQLPLPDGLPPVKPLDPAIIPAPLRGWLMDIADRMQIPPDFSTAAAVVALGSIIGRGCGINPRGLLINRDELIGWFRSLDKDGRENDRSFYLEAWNGNSGYTCDRIGRGTLDIQAICLSIFGALTPGPFSSYVYQANRGGNGDDGLLQRFQVIVWPDSPTKWANVDRFPDTTEKNRAGEIFKALSGDIPGALKEAGADIPALRFSQAGQDVFDTWRNGLETRLRGEHGLPPAMESHLTKYRSLMPSLALIFHLVKVVDGTVAPGPVSERAADMAATWCDYLESHAGRIYGAATMPGMDAAREIIKHIRRGEIKDGDTARSIYRGREWSRLTTPDEVRTGLEVLQEYDWLTVNKTSAGDRGGRPSEIIRLNPMIKL